jgi:hypothetical protein
MATRAEFLGVGELHGGIEGAPEQMPPMKPPMVRNPRLKCTLGRRITAQ